jgi:hypothetical protein
MERMKQMKKTPRKEVMERSAAAGWKGVARPLGFALGLAIALGLAHTTAAAGTVRLKDGSVIHGVIVSQKDSLIIIQSKSMGLVAVKSEEVTWIGSADSETAAIASATGASPAGSSQAGTASAHAENGAPNPIRDPADQALFFMPTAFLPPAKAISFRDFELFFLTLGFSPTAMTSLSAGFLFPISPDFQLLTAGIKQRVWEAPDGRLALALTGNFTKPIGNLEFGSTFLLNSNLVGGYRSETGSGVHLAMGYLGARTVDEDYDGDESYEWNGSFAFALGGEARIGPHAKFIGEFLSALPVGTGADVDGGLLTVGVRIHGERISADIAGTRPITESDLGSLLLWPLLVVSYRY